MLIFLPVPIIWPSIFPSVANLTLMYGRGGSDIVLCIIFSAAGAMMITFRSWIINDFLRWFAICLEFAYYVFMGSECYSIIIREHDFVYIYMTYLGWGGGDSVLSPPKLHFCYISIRWFGRIISVLGFFVFILNHPFFPGAISVLYPPIMPSGKMMYNRPLIGVPWNTPLTLRITPLNSHCAFLVICFHRAIEECYVLVAPGDLSQVVPAVICSCLFGHMRWVDHMISPCISFLINWFYVEIVSVVDRFFCRHIGSRLRGASWFGLIYRYYWCHIFCIYDPEWYWAGNSLIRVYYHICIRVLLFLFPNRWGIHFVFGVGEVPPGVFYTIFGISNDLRGIWSVRIARALRWCVIEIPISRPSNTLGNCI